MLDYILATFFNKKKANKKAMTIVCKPREILPIRKKENRASVIKVEKSSLSSYFDKLNGLNTFERINYLKG